MTNVVPAVQDFIGGQLPIVHWLLLGISALGSGWFVALGFAALGLLALSMGRRDLALVLAVGTLCFPMEWLLKYFTSPDQISFGQLAGALFDVGGHGLDDIADFPAGHAVYLIHGFVAVADQGWFVTGEIVRGRPTTLLADGFYQVARRTFYSEGGSAPLPMPPPDDRVAPAKPALEAEHSSWKA